MNEDWPWILLGMLLLALAVAWLFVRWNRSRSRAPSKSLNVLLPDAPVLDQKIDLLLPDVPTLSSLEDAHLTERASQQAQREAEAAAQLEAKRLVAEARRLEAQREAAEAARVEAIRQEERQKALADAAQAEAAQAEAERVERARQQAERQAHERQEAERRERQRQEAAQRQADHLEAMRLEAQRQDAEQLEAERLEAQRRQEAERQEAERIEHDRQEAARRVAQRKAALDAALQQAQRRMEDAARERAAATDSTMSAFGALQADTAPAPAAPVAPASDHNKSPADTLVMVADDSKVVRVKTSRLLAKHGFRVAVAEDGEDAMRQIASEAPDVLITDVEMPGIDGFELTRRVRGNPATARVPVIMITAADDKHGPDATAAGVSVLLGKPYSDEDLIARVESLVQSGACVDVVV